MAPHLAESLLLLSRLWADFAGRAPRTDDASESGFPCWLAVAAVHPLGDCDRSEPETSPDH
jgi:hypothetical protein